MPAGDAQALAHAMLRVLEQPGPARERALRLRERELCLVDWDPIGAAYAALLREACEA